MARLTPPPSRVGLSFKSNWQSCLDDVLEGEAEDGGMLDLLEVEEERHLPLQRFP